MSSLLTPRGWRFVGYAALTAAGLFIFLRLTS